MEIRIGEQSVSVTMRTPGHDFELAVGYLFTEGLLTSPADLREVKYCTKGTGAPQEYNIATVDLRSAVDLDRLRRATVTSSSCGLCGTDSIENLRTATEPLNATDGLHLDSSTLLTLPDKLRGRQPQFARTGGLHGVGLFDARGNPVVVREDVGRHNAVDKVIGSRVLASGARPELDLSEFALVVSGRVSFEIVQKAVMARIAVIVAVGAPTSLAIDAANELGVTLVGFTNPTSANLYTNPHRIT